MTITQISILSVPVSDQGNAKSFYLDTLGFELLADDQMGPDRRWVRVAPKGSTTSLTLVPGFERLTPGTQAGVVLNSDDVDTDVARLRAAGLTVEDPQDTPWGRQATFSDPDGNGFVLLRPSR